MSPRTTFRSCGNSSRLKRRSQMPTFVRRGSSALAHTGPVSRSASSTMVRNLKISNVFPSSVMRSWRSRIGPLPPRSQMSRATARKTGSSRNRNSKPKTMSISRLAMLFQPRSGTSFRLMIGIPSRSSRAALIVAYCTRSGTTLMSTHSLPTFLIRRSSLA